jgi:hypothetical protein
MHNGAFASVLEATNLKHALPSQKATRASGGGGGPHTLRTAVLCHSTQHAGFLYDWDTRTSSHNAVTEWPHCK